MANISRQLPAGTSALLRIFSAKPRAARAAPPSQPPPLQQEDGLYRRLSALGCTDGEVANAINEYRKEGKTVEKTELERYIKVFRRFKRYRHVLEIAEWMAQKYTLKHKDEALLLEAVTKVRGIAAAENYFNGLPPSRRADCTYGALLRCYCDEKMSDKALDLFNKMVEENMIASPLPFNYLMMMHVRLGQPKEALRMGEEMKKANIQPNTSTYHLLMSSYSLMKDFEGVESVVTEMKAENKKLVNWTTYSHMANIYIHGGDHEKARLALKDLEKEKAVHERHAYHFMLTLYARMSDPYNVRRVWKSLKSAHTVIWNSSYLIMIRTLANLDDMEGLKECFEEWEKVCSSYDVRLANTVIGAYLRHDMAEEAESALQRMLDRSKGPFSYTWEILMIFYLKKHDIEKAMKIMETAASTALDDKWKPKRDTVDEFFDYFKQESDVSGAEEFYELMKRINCVDGHFYESLLQIYVGAGQKLGDVRARIERDGVEIKSELEDSVASVSLESEMQAKELSQDSPSLSSLWRRIW